VAGVTFVLLDLKNFSCSYILDPDIPPHIPSKVKRESNVPVPLYQAKAEFFRTLGHPVRIRVLELLQEGPRPVHELLADIGVEASNLSQQLAVLRRTGLVVSHREGNVVRYELSAPQVGDLLRAARTILTSMLVDQGELLAELREAEREGQR
jgi:DNA-binding transcriptional ArsR family regulator